MRVTRVQPPAKIRDKTWKSAMSLDHDGLPARAQSESAPSPSLAEETAAHVLELLRALLRELHPSERGAITLTLDSHVDRDLALDSLARTELLRRIEAQFQVQLGEQILLAETPRDLVDLILQASGEPEPAVLAADWQAPALEPLATGTPDRAETLLEALDWHVAAHPDRLAIQIYGNDDRIDTTFSYAGLRQGAQAVAAGLQQRGLQPGQMVAIMLPTGSDYFLSFFGILLAGGVPVPIYPPVRPSQLEEHLRRHARLLSNAQTVALITVPEAKLVARLLQAQVEDLRHVVTVTELQQTPATWSKVPVHPRDLAFLQYTSGSTGDPKGVMLSHANLLANLRAMGPRVAANSQDVFVSWLPLYHDMGLIGACLGSLYHAFPLVVMSPLSFLARPARWLWAIHRHRGTLSAAPNFAYELCARVIQDHEIEGLDLRCWRMSFNGAEPVSPATLERFSARFSRYGFHAEAMAPVYGLAECSVGLALPPPGRGPVIDRVQRERFIATGQAEPTTPGDSAALLFPACGQPLPDHQIRVVDEQGRELPDRQEGRVEFKGPSATTGYYRNPEATRRLFPHGDDWLDSGDRGYLAGGDIYLTGRVKDLIIRGGRNLYPYELEQAVGEIPGIRKGCVAVFASPDPATGSERLVVVAETRTTQPESLVSLRQQIQSVGVDLLGTPPDEVVLAPPRTVLKTSSGKIRRGAVRELYQRNAIGQGGRALWLQLTRIALASGWAQARRLGRTVTEWLYAAYGWSVFGVLAPVVWLGIMTLPKLEWRWALARTGPWLLAQLTATPLTVRGQQHLPVGSCVLVANHSSFLDAYVLMAAIPRHFHYVAKRELLDNHWIARPLLRLGTLFVERFDVQRSVDEAGRLIDAAHAGQSLGFFPEGTFTRMPGLLEFRMGAFLAAAQAGVPVVPVTICGTRSILRAGSWFPRRGQLEVIIESPITPDGDDWSAAVRLRDAARAAILRHCGEPDLSS
ncbi:AMP-dependent synthetase and ligase [Candidatus Contendobacter odensis Run_B_J11]|uniref:AMP-dependent synthetase and ligase n=2 Tax=Candidatus Contendibacter odensensis TaxID=1400860 RepID=A0A7U7GEY6_9GAMM|nr:AMP-dependent synthetase and ligase [Candidatus Contendobacter odensis Run_B_J11]